MSRRTDLLQELLASNKFGEEKSNEQKFMMATAEIILSDLMNKSINGLEKYGAGTLVINMLSDHSVYMSGHDVEEDIREAERQEDEETLEMLRQLMEQIDTNDFTKNVLITLISDAGSRTFALEAGRSQECLRASCEEFSG